MLSQFLMELLAIAGIQLVIFLYLWRVRFLSHNNKGLMSPQPRGALPFIGHLHRLAGKAPLFRTLATMADEYGPIFTIWLGKNRALVISNHEVAKECFTKNDRVFATRPSSAQSKYLGYNYAAFGVSPYGKYWRDIRKLVIMELLSSRKLETIKHVQKYEVDVFIKKLYAVWKNRDDDDGPSKMVVMSEWIEHLTLKVMTKIIGGNKYFGVESDAFDEEVNKMRKLVMEFLSAAGNRVVADVVGIPEWMDFKGYLRSMKNIGAKLDSLMTSWLEEHNAKKAEGDASNQDFIDVLISKIEDSSMHGHTQETIIKATALILVLAGPETTSVSLIWIISLLLNNKPTLKLAQEELDLKVGRQKWVEETDIKDLVYLQAITKEALRLYPPGPLSVPHEAMEDCKVGGFRVPKGTHLYVNLWKIHRDPKVWKDPEVFSPERFFATKTRVEASGQHFELIPFGAGRRMCPGVTMAFQVMHLIVARLIQGFDLGTPMNKAVDMTEGSGMSMRKAIALEVVLTPRLTS